MRGLASSSDPSKLLAEETGQSESMPMPFLASIICGPFLAVLSIYLPHTVALTETPPVVEPPKVRT